MDQLMSRPSPLTYLKWGRPTKGLRLKSHFVHFYGKPICWWVGLSILKSMKIVLHPSSFAHSPKYSAWVNSCRCYT